MSLKLLADNMKQYGRGGDTELVHMSRSELHALKELAEKGGTGLTVNPHTGLPEAFNLKSLLPIAAGVAGSAMGMPWLGALAAGAMTTAETGSLQKGLMSGLGSYAMGSLGGQLLDAGATNLAGEAAKDATQQAVQQGSQEAIGQMGPEVLNAAGNSPLQQSMLDQFGQANYALNPTTGAITQNAPIGGAFNPSVTDKIGAVGLGDAVNVAKNNPMLALGAGTSIMDAFQGEPSTPKDNFDYGPLNSARVTNDYYRRNSMGYAEGGLASLQGGPGSGATFRR